MQRRQIARAEIRVVRDQPDAECLRQRGNLHHCRGTADLDDTGLSDILRPGLKRRAEVVQAGGVFSGGDGDAAFHADPGQTLMIAGRPDGFLQPGEVEVFQFPGHVQGLPDGPGAIHIGHQPRVVAKRIPGGGDFRRGDLVQFHVAVASGGSTFAGGGDLRGLAVAQQAGVAGHGFGGGAPQQAPEWLSRDLAGDVP